jgi:hypothetical protein
VKRYFIETERTEHHYTNELMKAKQTIIKYDQQANENHKEKGKER